MYIKPTLPSDYGTALGRICDLHYEVYRLNSRLQAQAKRVKMRASLRNAALKKALASGEKKKCPSLIGRVRKSNLT